MNRRPMLIPERAISHITNRGFDFTEAEYASVDVAIARLRARFPDLEDCQLILTARRRTDGALSPVAIRVALTIRHGEIGLHRQAKASLRAALDDAMRAAEQQLTDLPVAEEDDDSWAAIR